MVKTVGQFKHEVYNEFFSFFSSYNEKLVGVLSSILDTQPKSILDLACGVGLSTQALNSNFQKSEILGVDIEPNLISLARKNVLFPNIQFYCCTIPDLLKETKEKSFDLIFVKSAYHYFEHEIGLLYLKKFLKDDGAIVIAERTARSAKSYPLPEIASVYWENIFSEPRPSRRVNCSESSELSLAVSCYGELIKIPTQTYIHAVQENQLVGLWMLKPNVISDWINPFFESQSDNLEIFEEHWIYVYRNT